MFFYFFTLLGVGLVALGLSDLRPEFGPELEGLGKLAFAGMAALAFWSGCKWAWAGFRWALPKAGGESDKDHANRKPDKAPERDGDTSYVPRRDAASRANSPPLEEHKEALYEIQGGAEDYGIRATCNGCRQQYLLKDFEIDHIRPEAKGGGDEFKNLQLLCANCNRRKSHHRTMAGLRASLREAGIIPAQTENER